MSEIALSPELRSRLATQTEPQRDTSSLLNFIAQALQDPSIDVTKLQALLDMQRQVIADEAKGQFNRALAALSAELPQIAKEGVIDLGRGKGSYNFARIEDMDTVLRPLLAKHGFTLSFNTQPRQGDGGGAIIRGKLLHVSGHSEQAEIALPLDSSGGARNNLQAMGSTISYGRRYLTEMLLNIVRKGADDDGKLGGTKFLTAEQADEIEKLIEEAKADRAVFLQRFFEATDVANLPAEQYVPCKNMLLARVQARQRGTTAGE